MRQYLISLGLGEGETVTGALSLGFAAEGLPNRKPKNITGNPVTWV